jgi:hypothetical protein
VPNQLRSPGARAVLAAALAVPLTLGPAVVAVDRLRASSGDAVEHPVSDARAKAEVVAQAKRMVTVARLQRARAGYLLMSCQGGDNPPYQGAVYLTFTLPADARADSYFHYFHGIVAAMTADGWQPGAPADQLLLGQTLSRDRVTAVVYRDGDHPDVGVARLYGQCRDMTDHRNDSTGWVDVTPQIE